MRACEPREIVDATGAHPRSRFHDVLESTALGLLAAVDEPGRPQVGPVRCSLELGPEDGPPLAGGVDFGVVAAGRLQAITGFLDFAPSANGS